MNKNIPVGYHEETLDICQPDGISSRKTILVKDEYLKRGDGITLYCENTDVEKTGLISKSETKTGRTEYTITVWDNPLFNKYL